MKRVLLAAMVVAATTQAHAAGFQLSESSVAGLGRAFGGMGVMGDDLSALAYNPAGMTLIDRPAIQFGGTYVTANSTFHGTNTPGTSGQVSPAMSSPVPYFYAQYPVNDKFTVGLAAFAPFGLGTEYDQGWFGANHALISSVTTYNINPSVAYKINDKISVGAGVSAQKVVAELTSNVPVVGAVGIKGYDWSYGANAGIMVTPIKGTRIGLSYRSEVEHDFSPDNATATTGLLGRKPATTDITIPDYAVLSMAHELNDKWTLSGTVRWTDWSDFQDLDIYSSAIPPAGVSKTHEGWRDTWFFAMGADWKFQDDLTLRFGAAYDMTPIDDPTRRTARIPDAPRYWASIGATYHRNNWALDLGYSHLFIEKAKVDNTIVGQTNLKGEYKSRGDLFGASYTYKF